MADITTAEDFRKALADGPYAWPGGYPIFFVCENGDTLSHAGAVQETEALLEAIADGSDTRPVAYDINWEDESLYCDITNEPIECAYPSDPSDAPNEEDEE